MQPDAGELEGVRIFIDHPAARGGETGGGGGVVTFGRLRRSLPGGIAEQLAQQLGRWAKAAGPAWQQMLYTLFDA